jgi:tetratricopeptide (TPR) repeat protein
MTATRNPPEASHDELWQALAEGAQRLRELNLSHPADSFSRAVLKLFKERDAARTLDSIERLTRDLNQIAFVLGETYQGGRQAERAAAAAEPFGAAWMSDLRRRLEQLRRDGSGTWFEVWISAWTDALAALRWSRCDEIAELVSPASPYAGLRGDLEAVSALLRNDRPLAALPTIGKILAQPSLPVAAATMFRILRTRILRRFAGDLAKAEQAADEAVGKARGARHSLQALALVARAEVYQDLGRPADAHNALDSAMGTEDATLDLLLARGSLAMAERKFALANELYDAAVMRFGAEVIEPRLLREVPGNLLWHWARRLALTDKAGALDALDRALESGINGKGEFPAKKAVLEKAQLLEDLGRPNDAAQAYHQAADQYAWSESPKAEEFFRKAFELAPQVAEYRWSYGEVLRLKAVDSVGRVDPGMMSSAKQALNAGFALAMPDKEHAWAFASDALVTDSLGGGDDPALLIERALLLDPDYTVGYWLLSMVLRKQGFVGEALAAAREGHERDRAEFRAVRQLDLALRDRGDFRAALEVIEDYIGAGGNDPEAVIHKSGLLLRLKDPTGALEALTEAPSDSFNAMLRRGTAYALLGDDAASRGCFEEMWNRRDSLDAALAAWAAYRIGLLDEAAEMLAEVTALVPQVPYGLDLAQVRLVRGDQDRDDVAAGERILMETIDHAPVVDDLQRLTMTEFALVRRDIAGQPHEGPVLAILAAAERQAQDRCAFLRGQSRDPGAPAARLTEARMALSQSRPDAAFEIYLDFARQADPPEARLGLITAMTHLIREGDDLLRAGDLPAARAEWNRLMPAVALLPPDEEASQALQARLGLAALELDGPSDETAIAMLGACPEQAIVDALQQFARNVPTLWAHHDGLNKMATADTSSPADRAKFRSAAAAVPLNSVYALSQRLVSGSAALLSVSPIEIVLGAAHAGLINSPEIADGISALRDRLADETGVMIPGAGVRDGIGESPEGVKYKIYERPVARLTVPAAVQNMQGAAQTVLTQFERVIRDNLFRLISVDDVDLWRQGWNVFEPLEWGPSWVAADSFSKLRLARLLRMLLREGLPISDRASILAGFGAAERGGPSSALETLRSVRRRLYPAILGPDPEIEVHAMPKQFEDRVAAGLPSGDWTSWELDRTLASSLARDLRQWHAEQLPPGPAAVRVADWHIRPFVWHLMAPVRPRVYVLAEEELP